MANGDSKIIENVKIVMLKGEKGDAGDAGDYSGLTNKPKINSVVLDGDKSSEDLKLASKARMDIMDSRMDTLVDSMGREIKNLWTGSFDTIGGSITLSESVSNFDYLDIYGSGGAYIRVPVSSGNATLLSVNLSDNGSVAFQQTGEAVLTFSGTTVTLTKAYTWLWNYPENPRISSSLLGYIIRIDGVLNGSSSEVEDIRVGVDGTVYPSAGNAVRSQINSVTNKEAEDVTNLQERIDDVSYSLDMNMIQIRGQKADKNGSYDDLTAGTAKQLLSDDFTIKFSVGEDGGVSMIFTEVE